MADGWLNYVPAHERPAMAALASRGRPWTEVPEASFCSRCGGTLPPDVDGACEVCGSGTVAPPVPLLTVDEEQKRADEEDAALLPVRVRDVADEGRRSWWERFARFPHA